jgi:hypothetical protein
VCGSNETNQESIGRKLIVLCFNCSTEMEGSPRTQGAQEAQQLARIRVERIGIIRQHRHIVQGQSPAATFSHSFSLKLKHFIHSAQASKDSPLKNGFRRSLMPFNSGRVSADRRQGEQIFLQKLHKFMAGRGTPIGRLPSLGFKQRNHTLSFIWQFFF